jgi:hypothetical protein
MLPGSAGTGSYDIPDGDGNRLFSEQPKEWARSQPLFKSPACPAIFSSAAILHAGRGVESGCIRAILHLRFVQESRLTVSEYQGSVPVASLQ